MTTHSCPIVFFGDPGDLWSFDWLKLLLSTTRGLDYKFFTDPDTAPTFSRSIVVTNNSVAYSYIRRIDQEQKKFGVILLSDETISEDMFYLESKNCIFAARTYVNPQYHEHPKVFTFGLGYKSGFKCAQKSIADKRFAWSFAGSLKAHRGSAINEFCMILKPFNITVFDKFNDPKNLTSAEYAKILADSIFVPAPQGGASNDSFRIYEALEAGSIPVVMNNAFSQNFKPSYWHYVFPGTQKFPFICEDSWINASFRAYTLLTGSDKTTESLDLDYEELEKIQSECQTFWQYYKKLWQQKFKTNIEKLLAV